LPKITFLIKLLVRFFSSYSLYFLIKF
jgi:hypothetical protein